MTATFAADLTVGSILLIPDSVKCQSSIAKAEGKPVNIADLYKKTFSNPKTIRLSGMYYYPRNLAIHGAAFKTNALISAAFGDVSNSFNLLMSTVATIFATTLTASATTPLDLSRTHLIKDGMTTFDLTQLVESSLRQLDILDDSKVSLDKPMDDESLSSVLSSFTSSFNEQFNKSTVNDQLNSLNLPSVFLVLIWF